MANSLPLLLAKSFAILEPDSRLFQSCHRQLFEFGIRAVDFQLQANDHDLTAWRGYAEGPAESLGRSFREELLDEVGNPAVARDLPQRNSTRV
jgi:hypothetical protein